MAHWKRSQVELWEQRAQKAVPQGDEVQRVVVE